MTADARLLPWLQLVRLPAVLSAWSNILAAHLVATAGQPHWGVLALHLVAIAAFLWGGMALNDCFDLAEDRRERPDRPLPSGRIDPRAAWILGGGLMTLGIGLAALSGTASLGVGLALTAAILLYDGMLKGGRLGPLAMGICRYLSWTLGLSVLPIAGALQWLPLPVLLYTAAVTVLSGAETAGANPSTTRNTLILLAATAAMLILLVLAGLLPEPLALIALVPALYPLTVGLRRLRLDGSPETVRSLVRLMLLGMIPLDAMLLWGSGYWWAALALLVLLVPGRILARRISLT